MVDDKCRAYLPTAIETLFTNKEISSVYCMTLGKGDSYFVSYLGKDGCSHVCEYSNISESSGESKRFQRTEGYLWNSHHGSRRKAATEITPVRSIRYGLRWGHITSHSSHTTHLHIVGEAYRKILMTRSRNFANPVEAGWMHLKSFLLGTMGIM